MAKKVHLVLDDVNNLDLESVIAEGTTATEN